MAWCRQATTEGNLPNIRGILHEEPEVWSFDVLLDVRLKKLLNKQLFCR